MNSPQSPRPRTGATFESFLNETLVSLPDARNTPEFAVRVAHVNPFLLLDYVRGSANLADAHAMIAQSDWAAGRVVALVKSRRDPRSLGARILRSTNTDPYAWGIENTGDEVMDLALLLDQV